MKLMLGGTPVKKMMIHNDTMDATMVASDLQAGVTAYANGQKVTGTGKSFEFAQYGNIRTNDTCPVPSMINVIAVTSMQYPVKSTFEFGEMKNTDFSVAQKIGVVSINNVEYDILVSVISNMLSITCNQNVDLQIFFGKDNYV